jgi:hypothetical protein
MFFGKSARRLCKRLKSSPERGRNGQTSLTLARQASAHSRGAALHWYRGGSEQPLVRLVLYSLRISPCADPRARPNPSFKRSPNGVALGPRGSAVYHLPRGPSATPLVPA